MALIHWQPYSGMNSLQRDLNRLFDALEPMESESTQQFVPLIEMSETEDTIYLQVEVPGMDANDLDVRVTKEAVAIYGDRQPSYLQNGMARSEFRYGKFSRVIPLPTIVNNSAVKGNYQNGIMTLELPKLKEENKPIKVNLSSSNAQAISEAKPQLEKAVDRDTEQSNSPEGGYGNTVEADLWNEDRAVE